jgi:hypothetical protein
MRSDDSPSSFDPMTRVTTSPMNNRGQVRILHQRPQHGLQAATGEERHDACPPTDAYAQSALSGRRPDRLEGRRRRAEPGVFSPWRPVVSPGFLSRHRYQPQVLLRQMLIDADGSPSFSPRPTAPGARFTMILEGGRGKAAGFAFVDSGRFGYNSWFGRKRGASPVRTRS